MTSDDAKPGDERDGFGPASARDLADFYLRWTEFRPRAVAAAACRALSPEERNTISWLIKMADRVGPRDLFHSE